MDFFINYKDGSSKIIDTGDEMVYDSNSASHSHYDFQYWGTGCIPSFIEKSISEKRPILITDRLSGIEGVLVDIILPSQVASFTPFN